MKKYIPIFISPNSLIKYSLANIRSIHHRSVRNFSSQKKKKKKRRREENENQCPFVRVRVVEGEAARGAVRSKAKWKIGAGGWKAGEGGQAREGALAGWRRAEESFPVMRLLSKPISSWRAERPVPLASQKSTLDNASRYGWSNLLLSRTAARGEKKKAGGKGWGGRQWQGQDGGSRTYSRHTTSSCFIHRFETNSKRVLFVACFLFVTDNVVVLLLSELSGLYLPVQGCV